MGYLMLVGAGTTAPNYSSPVLGSEYGPIIADWDTNHSEIYNNALAPIANTETCREFWPRERAQTWFRVAQATGANQPQYRTSRINSRPSLTFDGTNDIMVMPTKDLYKGLTGACVQIVIIPTVGANRTVFDCDMSDGSIRLKIRILSTGALEITTKRITTDTAKVTTSAAGALVSSTTYLISLFLDYTNNTLDAYLQGQLLATGTLGNTGGTLENTDSLNFPSMGGNIAASEFFIGELAYLGFWSSILTNSTASALTANLATQYGVTLL